MHSRICFTASFLLAIMVSPTLPGFHADAQSVWHWQHPLPQANTLFDVCRTGPASALAVGVGGTILRTSDAGVTWDASFMGDTLLMVGTGFSRDTHGLAVGLAGSAGGILHSNDGGSAWVLVHTQPGSFLMSAAFASPDIAVTVGTGGTILRSTDGGVQWEQISSGRTESLFSVKFISASTGYIGGAGVVLYTDDAGETWTEFAPVSGRTINDVVFRDPQTGVMVGSGAVFTSDGGRSWIRSSGLNGPMQKITAAAWSGEYCIVAEEEGTAFRTSDFGEHWDSLRAVEDVNGLVSFDDGSVAGVGWDGILVRNEDQGATWQSVLNSRWDGGLTAVFFLDSLTGWAVGGSNAALTPSVVMLTHDGGRTWQRSDADAGNVALHDIQFIDENTGWAVGGYTGGRVMKSTDGGQSWFKQSIPTIYDRLETVFFLDENTGWTAGGKSILYTSNGGEDWRSIGNIDTQVDALYFLDESEGWAAGFGLYHTTDGGTTWATVPGLPSRSLNDIRFYGRMHGVAVGNGCAVQSTTDGGETWSDGIHGPTGTYLRGVAFGDADYVRAIGEAGYTIESRDGGITWQRVDGGCAQDMYAICAVDAEHFWAVGEHGAIIGSQPGSVTVVSSPDRTHPTGIALGSVYPNPAHGRVTVPYTLSEGGPVEIGLYDIRGVCLRRFSHDHPLPGKYSRSISLTGIQPGIYLCQLRFHNRQAIRRIVVAPSY